MIIKNILGKNTHWLVYAWPNNFVKDHRYLDTFIYLRLSFSICFHRKTMETITRRNHKRLFSYRILLNCNQTANIWIDISAWKTHQRHGKPFPLTISLNSTSLVSSMLMDIWRVPKLQLSVFRLTDCFFGSCKGQRIHMLREARRKWHDSCRLSHYVMNWERHQNL